MLTREGFARLVMATKPKRPRDINQLAHLIGEIATGNITEETPESDTRNPAAVALGAVGASKGGKARAKSLTKAERVKIAKKAASARWKASENKK
jgi:hypothetical protein